MTTYTSDQPTQSEQIEELQKTVKALTQELAKLDERTSFTSVVDRGLLALNDKLEPLSLLFNRGKALTSDESRTLAAIRRSLVSVDFTDLESPLVIVSDGKSPDTTGRKSL